MTDETQPRETLDERHERRLDALPGVYKTQHEKLALELALGEPDDVDNIFVSHGYSADQKLALLSTPAFAQLMVRMQKEVRENGISFRAKARVQAEDLLQHSYTIATDPEISPVTRLDAIKSTVKWAGLEPKEKDDGKGAGGGLTLNITFAGQQPQVVTHEPVTIEAER